MHRIVKVQNVAERLGPWAASRGDRPEEMRALVPRQYELWKKLAKDADIRIK